MLNKVQGHHLQLRSCPLLFFSFQQFNLKVAAAHHSIIQKEVDELLSKGVIEPSSCDAGFYSSVFAAPKCTDGLWPILNLKQFNHYLHIPYFMMPTIRHVWQLIQHGDFAFSTDLQDAYLHIPTVKHHCHFLQFVQHSTPYQWNCLLGCPKPQGLSWPSLHLCCSFSVTRASILVSIWMKSWSWSALHGQVKGIAHFCVPYWLTLDHTLIFQVFFFWH